MRVIKELLYVVFSAIYFVVISVPVTLFVFTAVVIFDKIKRAGKSLAQRQTIKK